MLVYTGILSYIISCTAYINQMDCLYLDIPCIYHDMQVYTRICKYIMPHSCIYKYMCVQNKMKKIA